MSGTPDPKTRPTGKGRAFRIVATKDEWATIAAAKQGPCRVCVLPESNGSYWKQIELHHVIPRSRGGDDVPANIVPLCRYCHGLVSAYDAEALRKLGRSLSPDERGYVVQMLGEYGPERLFGREGS